MTPDVWALYVDESGDFASFADSPIVAGLLFHGGGPAVGDGAVRSALESAAPDVPWPIHGWLLRRVVMYALWPHTRELQGRLCAPEFARKAVEFLEREAPDAFSRAVGALLSGGQKEPKEPDLRTLERALESRQPAIHGALWREMVRVRNLVTSVLSVVAAAETYLFAAGEAIRGDAIPESPDAGDRYLTLLACLFERVALALAYNGGKHRVDLHVLWRRLREETLGRDVRLHIAGVAKAAREAAGRPDREFQWGKGSVRLNPAQVVGFSPTVRASYVLADLAAGEARSVLASMSASLADVRQELHERLGVPIHFDSPDLTHAAASGLAQAHVAIAVRGEPAPENALSDPSIRIWAREQAICWATALGRPGERRS
ncbi:MAG: hypothetical protein HY720_03335 [Planctomycetes bacterium]|nr:hypothetical protein [Planctomycetota bacterium]